MIKAEHKDFWQSLANQLSVNRPYAGRRVVVTGGRKHVRKIGVVIRHDYDRYSSAFRYGGDANLHMREMAGRSGFVCLVQPDSGDAPFWVKADQVDTEDLIVSAMNVITNFLQSC